MCKKNIINNNSKNFKKGEEQKGEKTNNQQSKNAESAKTNDNPVSVASWVSLKLGKVSKIVEVGAILTVISLVSILIILAFKVTSLNIIGIPFQLIIDAIDIKPIDFGALFIIAAALFVTMVSLDFVLGRIKHKILFWVGVIVSILVVGRVFNCSSYRLSEILVFGFMARIMYLGAKYYFNNRPTKEIESILSNSSEQTKTTVVLFEIILSIIVVCICSMFAANLYLAFPSTKSVVIQKSGDEEVKKVVVYNSNSEIMTVKFEEKKDDNKTVISIDTSSIELVEKGNDPVQLTTIENSIIEKSK